MGNIGACFIQLRRFGDAVTSYEHIMNEHPDFKPGFEILAKFEPTNHNSRILKSYLNMINYFTFLCCDW